MKVFLGGEGPDELGDWFRAPQHRSTPAAVGILEALLRKVAGDRFTIVGAQVWKKIRKFRAGQSASAEARNVLGLMLDAEEAGCDVIVFVRDHDGYDDRRDDIDEGVRLARARKITPAVVGGVAVQEIEAWILALLGERKSERHTDAKAVLTQKHRIADCPAKVAVIDAADLTTIPEDAASLRAWLTVATATFPPPSA